MTHWILILLFALAPQSPFASTFPETAAAIDRASHEAPLYAGEDGPERTAAQLVAIAWFESRFDPRAVGDHGRSLGLFQVGVSNVPRLGVAVDDLFDPDVAARAAIAMLRSSLRSCRVRPREERLAEYASGSCGRGGEASRHRTKLAGELLRAHPVRWVEHEGTWGF